METRLTLRPWQPGTRKLLARYGDRLVCVRYLYDTASGRRLKTVVAKPITIGRGSLTFLDWQKATGCCMESSEGRLRVSWYERHVLPYLIDLSCSFKPVRLQRQKVVPLAHGQVLEIGIGTGLNLEHYEKARIKKIVGLDPGLEMHRLASKRAKRAGLPVELLGLSAEKIPLEAGFFDTVLVTYSLCTIADPVAALKEMRRVLKPDGKLLFCEHGLAPDESVRRWQDRLTPLWSKLAGGCQLNRDIPALLKEAGFRSTDTEAMYLPGPRPLTYNYWGTADPV